MSRTLALILGLVLLSGLALHGDEGMWTFDNPPRALVKERYGFDLTDGWLEHVRLASARLNDGGSGSFVSADGLLFTNQHVANSQLNKLSTPERNLVKDGFYAAAREAELKCPDLEVNVLVSYEDVTAAVQQAVAAGANEAAAAEQRKAAMAALEKASTEKTGLRSEVITLYSGGEYWLYRYKKYTDVRLVFAPEEQIAFFGGDLDNFTFPRFNLDITFFRVYENGAPAKIAHHLAWSARGAADGELVFVSGFPGSTARLLTLAQLQYQKEVGVPLQIATLTARRNALERYAALGPEQARQASPGLRGVENSLKRLEGQRDGLERPGIVEGKAREEEALKAKVGANPEWQKAYGSAWNEIAATQATLRERAARLAWSSLSGSRLSSAALTLVRYAAETQKPDAQRLPEFRDSRLESLRFGLTSTAPVYPALEEAQLAAALDEAKRALGSQDPFVRAALGGGDATSVARALVAGTQLGDPAMRATLLDGGPAAIAASADPMLALARRVDPVLRDLRTWQENTSRTADAAGERIARARFAAYGKTVYPDANFNLRLAYGKVAGYAEDTTLVPYKTTFYGLYERAAAFDEKAPFALPERWRAGRDRLDLATPFNFVYTGDTIGGNSGSPIVNRNAEIVGINFDSNVQKLPNRFAYIEDASGSRAVGVHSAGIIEALRKLYGAEALVAELTRTP